MLRGILRSFLAFFFSPLIVMNGAFLKKRLPHPNWYYYFLLFFIFFNLIQWQLSFMLDNPWEQFNQTLKLAGEKKVAVVGTPYDHLINKYAETNNLDPCLVAAVIQQESGFRPQVISSTGARGLMQIIPGTWNFLHQKGYISENHQMAFQPEANIRAGTKYLRFLADKYPGNWVLALASYNAGPGNVDKYEGVPPFNETRFYVKRVVEHWAKYRGDIPPARISPPSILVKMEDGIFYFNLFLWILLFFWLYRTHSLFRRY